MIRAFTEWCSVVAIAALVIRDHTTLGTRWMMTTCTSRRRTEVEELRRRGAVAAAETCTVEPPRVS